MNKSAVSILIVAVVLIGGYFLVKSHKVENGGNPQIAVGDNYKTIEYSIEGQPVRIDNTITKYFGDELRTDLDGDGIDDIAFLITQSPGGSGTFFYVVAALNTSSGYVGSDGYLLGDRIAPQNIVLSQNPAQKNVIVVNYADRKINEPMVTPPSVAKSVYLKISPSTKMWGIVEPNFEGESR